MSESTTLLTALGASVREYRIARRLSQEEFAHAVGLHRTYIGAVERGERNLTLLSLAKISDALGLKLSVLVASAESLQES